MIIQTNKKPKEDIRDGGGDNENVHNTLYNLGARILRNIGAKRFYLEKNVSGRDNSGMI